MEYQVVGDLSFNYTVLYQGKEFIKIIQKSVLLFGNQSQFYIEDSLVLETITYSFLFWQKIVVRYFNQDTKFDLFRHGFNYGLRNKEGEFTCSLVLLRKPYGKLYLNSEQIGEISINKFISVDPRVYDFYFYHNNQNYYFSIILFIMHLRYGI